MTLHEKKNKKEPKKLGRDACHVAVWGGEPCVMNAEESRSTEGAAGAANSRGEAWARGRASCLACGAPRPCTLALVELRTLLLGL